MNIRGINHYLSELFQEWNKRNGGDYYLFTFMPLDSATRFQIAKRDRPVTASDILGRECIIDGIDLNRSYDHLDLIEALKNSLK